MGSRFFALLFVLLCLGVHALQAQSGGRIRVSIVNPKGKPLADVNLSIHRTVDSILILSKSTDSLGYADFSNLSPTQYFCYASGSGFKTVRSENFGVASGQTANLKMVLDSVPGVMQGVTISAIRAATEFRQDRLLVNLDASLTNSGLTVMEAIQNIPGVSVDQNGRISFRGKAPVLVTIDGKNTYLTEANLSSVLGSMSADELSAIEVLYEPPAGMDAAGSGGVINLRSRKLNREGLNGSVTSSYAQGRYPKSFNNLFLNYNKGKLALNSSINYNLVKNFLDLYALRTYDGTGPFKNTILDQPSASRSRGTAYDVKLGGEYLISKMFSINAGLNAAGFDKTSRGDNQATWMNFTGRVDSIVFTSTASNYGAHNWNGTLGFSYRPAKGQSLTGSARVFRYNFENEQNFRTYYPDPARDPQAILGFINSNLTIFSARLDYSRSITKELTLNAGIKTMRSKTDNSGDYLLKTNSGTTPVDAYRNKFNYNEKVSAAYVSTHYEKDKLTVDAGLRYEFTGYNALQVINNSLFHRDYRSLFPNATVGWRFNDKHGASFFGGRRIDRPPYEKLNPSVLIINKYTTQTGNPYFLPQFTWNVGVSHQFNNILTSTFEYVHTSNVFSQIFTTDAQGGIVYSEGNLDFKHLLSLNLAAQLRPMPWWSLNFSATGMRQHFEGFIGTQLNREVNQFNLTANNQFKWGNWLGEISGYYNSRRVEDIQEVLYPMGQVSLGIGRQLLDNRMRLKLSARDIFYTQPLEGFSYFANSTEYFRMGTDSRLVTFSVTFNFGNGDRRKSSGDAELEEVERARSSN